MVKLKNPNYISKAYLHTDTIHAWSSYVHIHICTYIRDMHVYICIYKYIYSHLLYSYNLFFFHYRSKLNIVCVLFKGTIRLMSVW